MKRKLLLILCFMLLMVTSSFAAINANEQQTLNLVAGNVLTVAAPPGTTGLVVRLSRIPGGEAQSVTAIAGATLYFGPYADVERFNVICTAGAVTVTQSNFEPSTGTTDVEADAKIAAAEALTISKTIYVNKNRTDTYTADGTIFRPYKTVLAALTVINADTGKDWIVKIDRGTYADNLTITNPRSIRFEGMGVDLSGTILINSGVGSYDRIEFVGVRGHRAEKGPAMTISGAITATRTNDSLIYVGFHGCLVSGAFEATTSGTWVLQYENCRINGAITGTLAVNTQLDNTILVEAYGFNEFVGTISGIVSLYNVNGADFYCTINTTPWFENRFTHSSFAGSVSIIPQGAAISKVIYVDDISYKSFIARTPTITGATYSQLGFNPAAPGAIGGTTPAAGTFTTLTGSTIYIPEKTPVNAVAASKLLTIGTAPGEGVTVTIGGVSYKFTATVTLANDVLIGTVEESIDNLVLAVTAGAGIGTNYGTGTVVNPLATAVKASSSTMTTTNKIKGVIGNSTAIAESLADGSWAGAATFLNGGIDGTVGVANETCADATYIYHCVATNTIADANWRRVALGSAY